MIPSELNTLRERAAKADAAEILKLAAARFAPRLTFSTGFGVEGCVLIDLIARNGLPIDICTLDTGLLWPETYELWRRLEARYGLRIRAIEPEQTVDAQAAAHGPSLWERDPDRCCDLRKVRTLHRALAGHDAWVTAIRRDQTAARANAEHFENDPRFNVVKVNPLLAWTTRDIWDHVHRHHVPYNPLHDQGFTSIGCQPCTSPVGVGEDPRAGRWRGRAKTECGLHAQPSPGEGAKAPLSAGRSPESNGSNGQAPTPAPAAVHPERSGEAAEAKGQAQSPARTGFILWFTGMSGAGKTTLANALRAALDQQPRPIEILDGDEVRDYLSKGLGFSREDRDTNVRRIGYVARLLARNGAAVITAAISPYRATREEVRRLAEADGIPFIEVHAHAEIEALALRDVKGLYRKALAGELPHFTGVSDPYEPPQRAEVTVRSDLEAPEASLQRITDALAASGLISPPARTSQEAA